MPIFEFRCLNCDDVFERLFLRPEEMIDMVCPECGSDTLERVVSATNYAIGPGRGGNQPRVTTKSCSAGNQCTTIDLPGPAK